MQGSAHPGEAVHLHVRSLDHHSPRSQSGQNPNGWRQVSDLCYDDEWKMSGLEILALWSIESSGKRTLIIPKVRMLFTVSHFHPCLILAGKDESLSTLGVEYLMAHKLTWTYTINIIESVFVGISWRFYLKKSSIECGWLVQLQRGRPGGCIIKLITAVIYGFP